MRCLDCRHLSLQDPTFECQGYAQFAAAVVQRVICDWWHTQGQMMVVAWSPMCGWPQWEVRMVMQCQLISLSLGCQAVLDRWNVLEGAYIILYNLCNLYTP